MIFIAATHAFTFQPHGWELLSSSFRWLTVTCISFTAPRIVQLHCKLSSTASAFADISGRWPFVVIYEPITPPCGYDVSLHTAYCTLHTPSFVWLWNGHVPIICSLYARTCICPPNKRWLYYIRLRRAGTLSLPARAIAVLEGQAKKKVLSCAEANLWTRYRTGLLSDRFLMHTLLSCARELRGCESRILFLIRRGAPLAARFLPESSYASCLAQAGSQASAKKEGSAARHYRQAVLIYISTRCMSGFYGPSCLGRSLPGLSNWNTAFLSRYKAILRYILGSWTPMQYDSALLVSCGTCRRMGSSLDVLLGVGSFQSAL